MPKRYITGPSHVYIAPTVSGDSFKVGKANVPFSRLEYLDIRQFDLPRIVCLRTLSEEDAYRLETMVKHYFQRRYSPPAFNPHRPYTRLNLNREWFPAGLLSELDACIEECRMEIEFERIDDYFEQQAALAPTGGVAGLRYEATTTLSSMRRDLDSASRLAQLLRDMLEVSFRVTVLRQPGGELTEVQCQSVGRPEARQRFCEIEEALRNLTQSRVAKRKLLTVHSLAALPGEARLHVQLAFEIDASVTPKSEESRAIQDIYAEAIDIVRSVSAGLNQSAIRVMTALGIPPRKPKRSIHCC